MEWNSLFNRDEAFEKDRKYHRFHTKTNIVQTIIYKHGLSEIG